MDLSTITVSDFKSLFARDFPFLPIYDAAKLYNTGKTVYYPTTDLFYTALINGLIGVTPGSDDSEWSVTDQDIYNYILDTDITKAFAEAMMVFNQGLFGTDANIRLAYLYLTAHFLVNDIRTAQAGVSSTGEYPVTARAVGSVSESYSVPAAYLADPILVFYTKTGYGLKYLNMVLPSMVGNVVAICGATQP